MAAVTATPISLTGNEPLMYGGDPELIEKWYTMPGGSAADTITITDPHIRDIQAFEAPFVAFSDISQSVVSATVVLTLGAAAAAGTYPFKLIGKR